MNTLCVHPVASSSNLCHMLNELEIKYGNMSNFVLVNLVITDYQDSK